MHRIISSVLWVLLPLFLFFAGGCAGPGQEIPSREAPAPVRTIAMIPFQKVSGGDPMDPRVRCPLYGRFFPEGNPAGPEGIVENLFREKLASLPGRVILPAEEVREAVTRICKEFSNGDSLKNLAKLGETLGVDGIFFGFVYRFRERVGSPYSVEQPASVAFSVHLYHVASKEITWSGVFDKTQASLMENLLDVKTFFGSRGKWMTAEQLAAEGVRQVMNSFPPPPEE
jgi:hypothetical protein